MSYYRVLPRDLFNEAKLLKCLGYLCLSVVDGNLPNLTFLLDDVEVAEYETDTNRFNVQLSDAGMLHVANLHFKLNDKVWDYIEFYTAYNSRRNLPLQYETPSDCDYVFNDDGTYTDDFLAILEK